MNDRERDLRVFVAEDRSGRLAGIIALEEVDLFATSWFVVP